MQDHRRRTLSPQYDGSVPAPVCLIVNPSAGGGKAGRVAPEVERTLREHGLEVRRVDTRDLDHARELAEQGARAGETVVALSGDGMIGVVADVLRDFPGAVLGVLPGGRGNDLARVLGIPKDPIAACAVIARGVPRAMDLGEVARTGVRRDRLGRLRQRRQPHRQRSARVARQPRVCLRRAARARVVASSAL